MSHTRVSDRLAEALLRVAGFTRFSDRESMLVTFGFVFVSDFAVGLCEFSWVDSLLLSAPLVRVFLFSSWVSYCSVYCIVHFLCVFVSDQRLGGSRFGLF